MLATPSNPTGVCLSLDELADHYANVRRLGGALVVDEIYQGLEYGRESVTALALGEDDLFVVNSFSKFFGMTGWRVGWLVAPEAWVPVLERLAQNIFLAAPTVSQHAALAAFAPDSLAIMEQQRRVLAERRDLLMTALGSLGFKVAGRPEGAFYLYADCSALADDSQRLAEVLLEETGVAVTPGLDFGSLESRSYLRFAYTTDAERLAQGVQRIADYLAGGA
jgi:aspartate/methionine/tyrosine aminotransferase